MTHINKNVVVGDRSIMTVIMFNRAKSIINNFLTLYKRINPNANMDEVKKRIIRFIRALQ